MKTDFWLGVKFIKKITIDKCNISGLVVFTFLINIFDCTFYTIYCINTIYQHSCLFSKWIKSHIHLTLTYIYTYKCVWEHKMNLTNEDMGYLKETKIQEWNLWILEQYLYIHG